MNRRQRAKRRSGAAAASRPQAAATKTRQFRLKGNRYDVIEELSLPDRGRWLVRDHRPPPRGTRYVAIVRPYDEAMRQMLRSLRRLPIHAGTLPRLIDHGRIEEDYCLLLDWIPGIDLKEYLRRVQKGRTPRPDPIECIRLFHGLAHSLRLLHEIAQIVHGDLKPQNVILTTRPSILRMIDFGSSWQIERTRDRVAGDGFDPVFFAPECYRVPSPVSPASDQFSIGVMLYLMLTLTVPYGGLGGRVGHPEFRDAFKDELEPPSRLLESPERIPLGIRREMDALVIRMLQLDPAERFSNSRAWTNAFDRLRGQVLRAKHADPREPSVLAEALGWLRGIKRRIGGRSSENERED